MTLQDKFNPIRTAFYDLASAFFKELAKHFGYPDNPGIPTVYDKPIELQTRLDFFNNLPVRKTYWPPGQRPESWFEMIFGPTPKMDTLTRHIYENKEEGFYNFYIENYKNIFFLPNFISEFIQIRLNICLDITSLEIFREVLFLFIMFYWQIVMFRITISWWLSINPYTVPWAYIISLVDWTDDVLQGLVPSFMGVQITGSIFLAALGTIGDSLNHIVFTMPFLPNEGEAAKLLIKEETKEILVFHYLPILWYRYPIPNDIREFWYTERPDILEYMQTVYKDLDISFLPDNIIEELNQQKLTNYSLSYFHHNLVNHNNYLSDYTSISTLLHEFINNLTFLFGTSIIKF